MEVPVETPLQSKLDVSSFRRVLVAGFYTDMLDTDVDVASETARLLQNQLRSNSKLQVLDPDRPPLQAALERSLDTLGQAGEGGRLNRQEREQMKLEADRVLGDADFWKKIGEEFQNPLIITGKLGFEAQNRSGFSAEERVMRDPATNRPRMVRGNRYLERKGFNLNADFHFIDGKTGSAPAQGALHGRSALRGGPEDLRPLLVLRAHGPPAPELHGRDLAPAHPGHADPPAIGRKGHADHASAKGSRSRPSCRPFFSWRPRLGKPSRRA